LQENEFIEPVQIRRNTKKLFEIMYLFFYRLFDILGSAMLFDDKYDIQNIL